MILDVAPERAEALAEALDEVGLQVHPHEIRRSTMACTGIEFCKLAIVNTKDTARVLIEEIEARRPDLDVPLAVHVNGCPNSCARFQVADIGLKGMLVPDADGTPVEGFQVHLGGSLGHAAGFGRKLRALKVTSAELPDFVDRLDRALPRAAHRRRAVRRVGRPRRRGGPPMSARTGAGGRPAEPVVDSVDPIDRIDYQNPAARRPANGPCPTTARTAPRRTCAPWGRRRARGTAGPAPARSR